MSELATRDDRVKWCKARALALLDTGDHAGAVASMLSDIKKFEPPLYQPEIYQTVAMDGLMFRKTPDDVRHWIEGFN